MKVARTTSGRKQYRMLSHLLISCTSLATLWRNAATTGEESLVRVKSNLGSLQSALSNVPCMPESFDRVRMEKSADNDKIGDPLVRPKANGEQEEASIRKSIKVLSASWQVQAQVNKKICLKLIRFIIIRDATCKCFVNAMAHH